MQDGINVGYLKLSINHDILEVNSYFVKLLMVNDYKSILQKNIIRDFRNNYSIWYKYLVRNLDLANPVRSYFAYLNFKNYNTEKLGIFYLLIHADKNSICIYITNWLNWINKLNDSLDLAYSNMMTIKSQHNIQAITVSEAQCFKAFYPLLSHIPYSFFGQISAGSYFNIMSGFNNKRSQDIYSKDYHRDTLSRIKHELKNLSGTKEVDIMGLIKNNKVIDLNVDGDFLISNTNIKSSLLISCKPDQFLNSIILNSRKSS